MTKLEADAVSAGLVLACHGPAGPLGDLQQRVGPALAAALAMPWAGFLNAADPRGALVARPHGLVALPRDPGETLPGGGHWAEALGAHRQPVVVLLTAAQVACGVAAARAALLGQEEVPLLGLVQWGGPWDADLRRAEGLPWLGCLAPEPDQAAIVRLAARQRWAVLAAWLAPQG